ncbi:MAG TPA: cytochrome C oxidase subunit I [Paucimonas sp.]|nr:cytochrome C oxidase subunit I [Paucimonas sp.]
MFAVLAVCAAPLIFSYFTYYVIKPEGRTNYGALIDPRAYPIPQLGATSLDGKPAALEAYKGKWIMLQVDGGDCAEACRRKLMDMRQLRLMQGKEMDRIERVWLITDDKPVETIVLREYDGTRVLRVKPEAVTGWLPVEQGTAPSDHIYMIDPLGNLMMRFPKNPDPGKMKKDIGKLLKASRIG